jgi:hypothetical protein
MRIKINIPTKLNEVTLGQYQEYLKAQEKQLSEFNLGSKMIEIFCNIERADLIEFRMSHITKITRILSEMFAQENDKLIRHFKMKNIEYGFIPNLDEMTFGEYVDVDSYLQNWDDMHKAMSVLYRPIKQKHSDRYTIEKYDGKDQDRYKQMPLDVVFSSIVFFYNLGRDLSLSMMDYLTLEEKLQLQESKVLDSVGGGISQFMLSLKEILRDTQISLN